MVVRLASIGVQFRAGERCTHVSDCPGFSGENWARKVQTSSHQCHSEIQIDVDVDVKRDMHEKENWFQQFGYTLIGTLDPKDEYKQQ